MPHYDDRERYATLTLMHRGQRLADQPFAASYPGLLTLGIDSPATYIYREHRRRLSCAARSSCSPARKWTAATSASSAMTSR